MAERVELSVPALPESAARARAFIREHSKLDSIRHAEADLLITELIGNAINHSPDADDLLIGVGQDRERGLVVTLTHAHPEPLAEGEGGVGFMVLNRLSRNWGTEHDGENLTVWFTLRTPGTVSIAPEVADDDLFEMMAADPAAYSDELVRRHRDLAASISRRYRGKGIDDDDLVQVANMALLKAIQRYDPSLGSIRPYAAATISGELKRLLRDRGWSVRVPRSLQERSLEVAKTAEAMAQELNRDPEPAEIAEKLDLDEAEVLEAIEARQAYSSSSVDKPADATGVTLLERLEDEDIQLIMADDRVVVEEAMAKLPERQQRILQLRFNEDLTQSEIAEEIGISQMHVSRLLSRALKSLKNSLGSDSEP
ncbi:MAG TPA: sigma-70 family RNA polymerase sigma factor [Acidimicrobiia bacterium]|nr:sigma-70 family RNA polymerase sigma factor [Acidimicrobiia bacterium]